MTSKNSAADRAQLTPQDHEREMTSTTSDLLYQDVMALVEKMPHVKDDLETISQLGANRDRMLMFLATFAFWRTSIRVLPPLQERELALEQFAKDLDSLAARTDEIIDDEKSNAMFWLNFHGLDDNIGVMNAFVPPEEPGTVMRMCARWAEKNARAIGQLQIALRVKEPGMGITIIMDYLRSSTGKYCDEILARLLNAATDALGGEEDFSAEGLKKLRQRQRDTSRLSKAFEAVLEISKDISE